MAKGILSMIFALVFFAAGYINGDMKAPVETVQELVSESAVSELDVYMESVKAQSDAIKVSLEQDPLTQMDMNEKSQELYLLWNAAMEHLLAEAGHVLPDEEFAELSQAQRIWLSEKESAVQAAGKEFEGGSIYAMVVNGEAAALTEARVYELYEMLKQPGMQ